MSKLVTLETRRRLSDTEFSETDALAAKIGAFVGGVAS